VIRAVPFRFLFTVLGIVSVVDVGYAQQRPLETEDPEVIGPGRILIEGGFDWERDVSYPVSGLRGHRLSVPTLGVSVGLSSIVELQVDGGLYQRLNITARRADAPAAPFLEFTGDETHDVEDFVIATKLRLVSETLGRRPAIGLRLATKLPNANTENGLGTDLTDFFATMLIGKTIRSIRFVGNAGVGIVADASSEAPAQHDFVIYGFSVARAMTTSTELVGEVNGRLNFAENADRPGGASRGALRFGARYTHGTVRVDAGALIGITSLDPEIGVTAGFTWVFNAFRVP
jgi:hypothetical protein